MPCEVFKRLEEYEVNDSVRVNCGSIEIRPIRPGAGLPWQCEVWIDGVKQERVVAADLLLSIRVDENPRLTLLKNVIVDPKAAQVAEAEVGDG